MLIFQTDLASSCLPRTRTGLVFHRASGLPDEDKSDRLYIGSASGKFVTGPNAGIAFRLSDIDLPKEGVEGDFAIYGSANSPSIQTVSYSIRDWTIK